MEWKEVTLGEITNLVIDYRGKTPLKLGSSWSDSGYRALSAKNIKTGQIVAEDSIRFVGEELYRKWMKDEVKRGDILITSEAPFGQIYYWDSDEKIVLSQRLFDVRLKDEVCHKYVYYFMTSYRYQKDLEGRATGTTVTGLRQPELLKSTILLPPLSAQRSIASILSSLDRKIELNNKINADLEEMAQAIFKNWFVDFEPFKDGKFVDSELGMIPEGWKVGCLGDMGAVVCGKTPSKSNSNYYGGDIPFIKIPDMHGNVFVENSEDRLTEEGSLSQIKKLIPPYSLMVSCIATVGLVSINTKPSHTNQQINTVIPHNKSALFYLYQHIKNNEEFLKNMGRGGTTTLNVNTKSFSNIRLLIPSEIALEQFHGIVEGLFKKIEQNLHESRTLSLLRDTLLPRLMSGELEVPE